jgi:multiple antibiotic resistance protein
VDISFITKTFITFFTVIDPLGLVPVVLVILANNSLKERKRIITRAVIIGALVIFIFALLGKLLIESLGIGLYAFNIAGGALLFLIALDMLFGRTPGTRETPIEEKEAISSNDVSVFPLAIPMIAGPGTIATTILFADGASGNSLNIIILAIVLIFILLIAWIVMIKSSLIMKLIGRTGILVFSRILGIILAALAVQYVLNGIQTYLKINALI